MRQEAAGDSENPEQHAHAYRPEIDRFVVELSDGRAISVPYAWFPLLASASREDRSEYELIGSGYGIHWPRIGEDLSVAGLPRG